MTPARKKVREIIAVAQRNGMTTPPPEITDLKTLRRDLGITENSSEKVIDNRNGLRNNGP